MNVKFYSTQSDRRALHKQLSQVGSANCTITDECSVYQPSLILQYNRAVVLANYAYIQEWSRYYFITSVDVMPGGRMRINLKVDVLYSNVDTIETLRVEVIRNENLVEPYLPDNKYVFLDTYDVINKLPVYDTNIFDNQANTTKCFVIGICGAMNSATDIPGYIAFTSEPANWSQIFPYCYVNIGTTQRPEMWTINQCIAAELISLSDAQVYNTVVSTFGTVYAKS